METKWWPDKSPLTWVGGGLLLIWSGILLVLIFSFYRHLTYIPDQYVPRYDHDRSAHHYHRRREPSPRNDASSQHNQPVPGQKPNSTPPQTSADERIADLTAWLVVVGAANAVVYWLQWGLSRKTARQQLRAYVCLAFGKDEKAADPTNERFTMYVRNCGQTPARHLTGFIGWKAVEGENAPWPKGESENGVEVDIGGSRATLGPGEPAPLHTDVSTLQNPAGFRAALERANRKECTLYIIGRLTYLDIFGCHQFTEYCFTHVPGKPLGHTIVCGFHNESS